MYKDKKFDIADEADLKKQGIEIFSLQENGIKIKKIKVKEDVGFTKRGNYYSFEIKSLDEKIISKKKIKIIAKHIKDLLLLNKIKDDVHVLIVGLGNDEFSSDSLGPLAIKAIKPSYYQEDNSISCIIPGVMKTTGLESANIIKSLVKNMKFNLVIVIDSLTTTKIDRLYKLIQLTDTEIVPGGGIKNFRKKLSSEFLGVPLIALGVSMAISYEDILENIYQHLSLNHKLDKANRKFFLKELNKDYIMSAKDIELKVSLIAKNIALIINELFI